MLLNLSSHTLLGRDRAAWSPHQPSMVATQVGGLPTRPRLPGWLLIGSTGRNSGKTEFACAIIRAFRGTYPIVGVKVTAIVEGESSCPRGGGGCGVCAALLALRAKSGIIESMKFSTSRGSGMTLNFHM